MEPSEELDSDIKALRSSILNSVPGAIRAIDGALMGTGFAEGMTALFARIQFKESATLDAYAESFYLMFQYYYSRFWDCNSWSKPTTLQSLPILLARRRITRFGGD